MRRGWLRTRASISPVLALLVVFVAGCDGRDEELARRDGEPRLVVLYATCTVNTRYLSPYRSTVGYTPRLKEFADSAVVFERHRAEAPLSGIAFASIFSGGQAPSHGIFSHPARLPESVELIGESFAAAGYDVFYWNRQQMVVPELGYGQGASGENVFRRTPRGDDPDFERILERLRRDPDYRALVVTAFTVTHAPYSDRDLESFCMVQPSDCGVMRRLSSGGLERWAELSAGRDRLKLQLNLEAATRELGLSREQVHEYAEISDVVYRSRIGTLDWIFGSLVAAVDEAGLRDQSVIAFTADHGEELYREGGEFHWGHGFSLSAHALDVPLIIRAPGIAPSRYRNVTRSIDVFATLAGLAGIRVRGDGAGGGTDLSRALRGVVEAPELVARSHTGVVPTELMRRDESISGKFKQYFPAADIEWIWVAVRSRDLVAKLRRSRDGTWGPAIFDLSVDPEEVVDIYRAEDPLHAELAAELDRYKAELVSAYRARGADTGSGAIPEQEQRDRLRSLGYID